MNVDNCLRDLLPILYSAPIEPSKWQTFLDQLSEMAEISTGYLVSSTSERGNVCLAGGGANYDPEAVALYNNQYSATDPFRAGFLANPRLGVIEGNELVRQRDLVKTEVWNEVFSPYGLHNVTMLCGNCDAGGIQTLALWRDSHQGLLSSDSLQLLQALVPHIQTTLRLNERLLLADSRSALSDTALDSLDIIVVLVDGRGRVQHVNIRAAKRLHCLPGISLQSGRLTATDAADDARLQNLVQRATASLGRGTSTQSGGAMKIRHPQTNTELRISVIPATERAHIATRHRSAAIFIDEPNSKPRHRGEVLRELYRLTATEARLADCLLEGKDLREAAEQLSITWTTARFHLKRVFEKTGACRQTELMRLMLTLPGRTD